MAKVRKKRVESLSQQLHAIIIRIPINAATVTTALLFTQQVIELARVIKIPLQVENTAPMEPVTLPPPAPIEPAPTEVTTPTETKEVAK